MRAWREVAVPHRDVLQGTFQQSEFAADITAVRDGRATREYQDAAAFFERTYITEGMRLLLSQVVERLLGRGGEPVVQLQTAFGGGKTHTMLAVYHLATRRCSLADLPGIPALLDQLGVMDLPRARVAIIDGSDAGPAHPRRRDGIDVHTLWGDLAWQLGGPEAFDRVRGSDLAGTSPGKEALRSLIEAHAPCVVLIDELVAYVRQFRGSSALSGGTYDSNMSFVQALTEAIKMVPSAILLASLPDSELEAGSRRGVKALKALEKTFGRVQALWKPVGTEEAFEIVRRRLFEPIRDTATRDAVCRAFAEAYKAEGARMPSETQEERYFRRLVEAYPIHPEVFDRLYEDWSTLESFQRTRGVLKLMARVIHRLWKDDNNDALILPGSLPLYDSATRNELLVNLPAGWDPVIEGDIDGERSEAAELDAREVRFGAAWAARRAARTVFLGSAPSSSETWRGRMRGVDRARVLLGCLQPGQSASLYGDALNRLVDRLHYLNTSGDKTQDSTRFWFDTRANLRREMEDRKGRFDERLEVHGKIKNLLQKMMMTDRGVFKRGVHIFVSQADVPDDGQLRLIVLPPDQSYNRQEPRMAFDAVLEAVQSHGSKPRFKANRLMFVAADGHALLRLLESVRTALAWQSIVDDIDARRLNVDRLQEDQAKKERDTAERVAARAARECYRWLLCPVKEEATDREIAVEAHSINTAGSSFMHELDRVCEENELVISTWSPIHLRRQLRELYWKDGVTAVRAMAVFEDMQKYLYMPRLESQAVYEAAIAQGAATQDFFGTARGQDGDRFEGFSLGADGFRLDDTVLLIEPDAAMAYEAIRNPTPMPSPVVDPSGGSEGTDKRESRDREWGVSGGGAVGSTKFVVPPPQRRQAMQFHGAIDVSASTAKIKLVNLADEIISLLASDPSASVRVTVEIGADYPEGAPEHVVRGVTENAVHLGFKLSDWE